MPRILARAILTREKDVVKLVFQQLPSLLRPAQHHSKTTLQKQDGNSGARYKDSGDLPTGQDRDMGMPAAGRQSHTHLVQILGQQLGQHLLCVLAYL